MGKIEKIKEFFKNHENCFVNYRVCGTKKVCGIKDNAFNIVFKNAQNDLINIKSCYEIEVGFVETGDKLFLSDNLQVFMNSLSPQLLENKKQVVEKYLFKYGFEVDKNFLITKETNENDFVGDTINFVKAILTINKIKDVPPYVLEDEKALEAKEDLIKTWIWNKKLVKKTEGEICDLFDLDRQLLKEKGIRGNQLPENTHRLTVHIVFFNSQNQMLIQKRASTKRVFPGIWDVSVAGGVLENETSEQAMKREIEEEIGIKFDFGHFRPSLTINFRGGFDDYYLIKDFDVDTKDLRAQVGEVDEFKWASKEEVMSLIETNNFTPYEREFISSLFELKNIRGALIEY